MRELIFENIWDTEDSFNFSLIFPINFFQNNKKPPPKKNLPFEEDYSMVATLAAQASPGKSALKRHELA